MLLLLDFSLDISAMFNISYFHFYITINKNLTACVLGLAISSTFKYTDFEKKKTWVHYLDTFSAVFKIVFYFYVS